MRIVIDNPTQTLIMSGGTNTQETLTAQLAVSVTDSDRNVELYYDTNRPSVAEVDEYGRVTAVGPGVATITVCAARGPVRLFTCSGMPMHPAARAEATVTVRRQYVPSDYCFSVDYADGEFTIAQQPVPFSTFCETVAYRLGTRDLGIISGGRGSLTFVGPDPTKTFTVNARSESGVEHQVFTSWGNDKQGPKSVIRYPVLSSR